MTEICQICREPVRPYAINAAQIAAVSCPRCGTYVIDENAFQVLSEYKRAPETHPELNPDRLHLLSAAVRRLPRGRLVKDLEALIGSVTFPSDPFDGIDRLVLYVLSKLSSVTASVKIEPSQDYPTVVARNSTEMSFYLQKAVDVGYLVSAGLGTFSLTLEGWRHALELRKQQPQSNQAFVAMSFASELLPVWKEGLEPALRGMGYVPVRVDQQQYNEKIDDRIVAEIRKSSLLIADVTGHRQGVYFEAGFAMGLGIPVIWTCRDDDMKNAHFDTRQYNHITWTTPVELRTRVTTRIEATIPGRARTSV